MKIFLISMAVFAGISYVAIFFSALLFGKGLKRLFINAILGISALIIVNLTAKYTGVHIPVNVYSVAGAGMFSVPAVILLLILRLLFKI